MAKSQDRELTPHTLEKGRTSRLLTRGLVSKDQPYIDIRTQYLDDSDEWQFTQKGVRLHAEMVPELLEQIKASLDEIDETLAVGTRKENSKKPKK